jgi:curved DNA-binding protein CbpA
MSTSGELSPLNAGAEVLSELVRRQPTGVLAWQRTDGVAQLELAGGRAVRATGFGPGGQSSQAVSIMVRGFACAISGPYRFIERDVIGAQGSVDVLGEALVGVLTAMTSLQLDAVWRARGEEAVEPTPAFTAVQRASVGVGAPALPVPAAGQRLRSLVAGAPVPLQRALAAQLFLGGLATRTVVDATPVVAPVTTDPKSLAAIADIEATYEKLQAQSLYETLAVAQSATTEEIRKAYLEMARRWHSDSFAGLSLGPTALKAEEIFRRVGEAQRVLSDPEQRKGYDFVLERQRQGLPSDPGIILEAEASFRKGQALVRRGQGPQALPALERAVELNRGEAEFWVYLGFALFAAKGRPERAQAEAHIKHGLELRPNLDVAYEFLGKIARVEGAADDARRHFRKALELNPKNVEAERELRVIAMRAERPVTGSPLAGAVEKLFKKKS